MNALPVIRRELLSEARNSQNHWLRVIAAGVMIAAVAFAYLSLTGSVGGKGWKLFGVLQPTLYTVIWLLVPIMTCDCLSRERREGTLGLLFLTPLRPVDVLLAKATSSVLRALSLFLAAGPVIVIMLLLGGVGWPDLLRALLMNATAMLGAIAAGLIASSRCRNFRRAALLAILLGVLLMIASGAPQAVALLLGLLAGGVGPPESTSAGEWILALVAFSWVMNSGVAGIWAIAPVTTGPTQLWVSGGQVVGAGVLLLVSLWMIGRRLRRGLVETGMTVRQAKWWRIFCTPQLFTGVLRRWNRRQLDRNPIGWLQRRNWTARVSMWGWVTFLAVFEFGLLQLAGFGPRDGWYVVQIMQPFLAGLLFLGVSFSAADSLREERETCALELLLVTPLTVRKLILGRLFGLWGQHLPAFLILGITWLYVVAENSSGGGGTLTAIRGGFLVLLLSTFLTLPAIGLCQSLRRRLFLTAWMLTAALGVVFPVVVPCSLLGVWDWAALSLRGQHVHVPPALIAIFVAIIVVAQLVLAGHSVLRVARALNRREFLALD